MSGRRKIRTESTVKLRQKNTYGQKLVCYISVYVNYIG